MKAFIGFLYAREAYKINNLKLLYLWDRTCKPKFFSNTISIDFTELLKFICFYKKKVIEINVYKVINLFWYNLYKIGLFKIIRIVTNQQQILQLTNNYFHLKQDTDLLNICRIKLTNLILNFDWHLIFKLSTL